MIVTVIAVCMVEVTFHQVIGMVAVRNRFVSAIGPVFVSFLVSFAIVVRGTRCLVFSTYGDSVLVNMTSMRKVEVSIMQIVQVAVVLDGRMSAVRTMHVRVRFVNLMIGHYSSP